MRRVIRFPQRLAAGGIALLIAACSSTPSGDSMVTDRRTEYRQARSVPSLEIPPDLTSSTIDDTMKVPDIAPSSSARLSDYASERAGGIVRNESVLPLSKRVTLKRTGDKRWLVIDAEPEEVWEKMRDFWLSNGWLIMKEDPRLGLLETDWAENRADIPTGVVRGLFSKVIDSLYSAATRDRYRVRLERSSRPGVTELYLTHRGVEEVLEGDRTIWTPRPADPELEAEMLGRLMVHLGFETMEARRQLLAGEQPRPDRARLNGQLLLVTDPLDVAWRRTGIALDRIGFTVEDRNLAANTYFVRYNDPLGDMREESWVDKLAFWRSDDSNGEKLYQIVLAASGVQTTVVVKGDEGSGGGGTPARILKLLYDELR
jgi:outer membrane protein assembly factor BamC